MTLVSLKSRTRFPVFSAMSNTDGSVLRSDMEEPLCFASLRNWLSSSAKALALRKRSAGSLFRHFMQICSRLAGMSFRNSVGTGGISAEATFITVASEVFSLNGGRPVSSV